MNKLICKIFGHRFKYFIRYKNNMIGGNVRFCKRCYIAQEWGIEPKRDIYAWVYLGSRTKEETKEFLATF